MGQGRQGRRQAAWAETALSEVGNRLAIFVRSMLTRARVVAFGTACLLGLAARAQDVVDAAGPPGSRAACIAGGEIALDPAAGLHLGTQSYPQTLRLCDHVVILTFDDGPTPDTTPRILDALKDAGVHATFFLIGRNTREHPDLARRERAEGHTVGHHSNTHPSFTLRGFDEASATADIGNGIAADERALYGDAASPATPHVPFFRFPGFADTPALLRDLDSRGIGVFGSDLWAGDWIAMSPDRERTRVMALLARRPRHNGIILLHDSRRSTAAMLPALLADFRTAGYRIAHLVYRKGAPVPPLTPPLRGEPETQQIIAHLPTPIVPGTHHLAGAGMADRSSAR